MDNWDSLRFWQSGEWQVIQERLDALDAKGTLYNPARHLLFTALDSCPLAGTRVCIMGQDPYPVRGFATGVAFSIPRNSIWDWPPTLRTLLKEYEDDLHLPTPKTGCLDKWAQQGILLWNAVPSCETGKSLSHNWDEWTYLTKEIVQTLSDKGSIVFVFLGRVARQYAQFVDTTRNSIIETGHPSPRGNMASKVPFSGSRIYTTINSLIEGNKIDWNLEGAPVKSFQKWPRKSEELLKSEPARVLSTVSDTSPSSSETMLKPSPTSVVIREEESIPF